MKWKPSLLRIMLLLAFNVTCRQVTAQPYHIGSPIVQNFSSSEYNAGPENWAVDQDRNTGTLYFGNNDGLLSFDSSGWKLNPLPNKSVVRSVAVSSDGRIYVGGQGVFGFFAPKASGKLEFTCLSDSIEKAEDRNFDDVWRIYVESGSVLFTTYKMVARYHPGEKVRIFPAGKKAAFEYGFLLGGEVFAFHFGKGFCRLNETSGQFETIPGTDSLKNRPVKAIFPFDEKKRLIPTQRDGIFVFDGETTVPWLPQLTSFFKKVEINNAAQVAGGRYFAFATKLNGVLIFDQSGKLVTQINKERGLPNDNVLSIREDMNGDLWLGLHNGIAKVMLSKRGYFVFIPPNTEVGAHSSAVFDGKLWLATTNGLFFKKLGQEEELGREFQMVEGTAGDAWHLANIGGNLLFGHDQGAFAIQGEGVRKISPAGELGFWRFMPVPGQPDYMIAGNYSGLARFHRDPGAPGGWRYDGKIKGIVESCRIMEFDERTGYLWMTHVYKGAFRIKLSSNLDSVAWSRYGKANGLPSDHKINVFKIDGEVVFGTEAGVYRYDPASDRFLPHEGFRQVFGDATFISLLVKDPFEGGIWFVEDGKPGFLERPTGQWYRRRSLPGLEALGLRFKTDFENINPIAAGQTIFGGAQGFYVFGENVPVSVIEPEPLSRRSKCWFWLFGGLSIGALLGWRFFWRKQKRNDGLPIAKGLENNGVDAEEPPSGFLLLVENAYAKKLSKLLTTLKIPDPVTRTNTLNSLQKEFLHFLLQTDRLEKDMMLYLLNNSVWKKQFGKEYKLGSSYWKVAVCLRDGRTAPSEINKIINLGITRIGEIKKELLDKIGLKDYAELEPRLQYYLYPFLREAKQLLAVVRDGDFNQETVKTKVAKLLDSRPELGQQLKDYSGKKAWMRRLLEENPNIESHDLPYLVCLRNEIGQNDAMLLLDYPSHTPIDKHRIDLKKALYLGEKVDLNDFILHFGEQ